MNDNASPYWVNPVRAGNRRPGVAVSAWFASTPIRGANSRHCFNAHRQDNPLKDKIVDVKVNRLRLVVEMGASPFQRAHSGRRSVKRAVVSSRMRTEVVPFFTMSPPPWLS